MLTLTPKSFPQLPSGQSQAPQFCRVSAVPRHCALLCSSQTCALPSLSPFGLFPCAHKREVGDSPGSSLLLSLDLLLWEYHLHTATSPSLPQNPNQEQVLKPRRLKLEAAPRGLFDTWL